MGVWVAIGISVLSLAVAVIGTVLSNRRAKESRDIAREALQDSRQTRADALWSSAVEAVNRVYGVDPMRQDVQQPLQNLRVAWIALVDGLPDWTGLDEWLAAEHSHGAAIGRQVLARATLKPPRDEAEHMALLKPHLDWGIGLSGNLRHLRSTGHDGEALAKLRDNARANAIAIYERNGWDLPEGPNFEPL
jgi:heme exporter protein D